MKVIEVSFQSPFHQGSGYGLSGVVDRAVLRDRTGLAYLAGSAIKGKVRNAALRILLSTGEPACEYGDDRGICKGEKACAVCQLFGSPARRGRLLFSDAYPVGDLAELLRKLSQAESPGVQRRDSSVRFGIGISRCSGRVRPQFLFSTETLPEGLRFESRVEGDLSATEETLVRDACQVITHFGSGGARGLGRCRFQLKESR